MSSGVYLIQSICKPQRQYVGSSVLISRRWSHHARDLVLCVHANAKLQHHVKKYGYDDLIFSVLEFCDIRDCISREQFYIDKLHPWFNICKVARSRLGVKCSSGTRLKMKHSAKRAANHRKRHFISGAYTLKTSY